jgi:hypothetical protein
MEYKGKSNIVNHFNRLAAGLTLYGHITDIPALGNFTGIKGRVLTFHPMHHQFSFFDTTFLPQ